jgi:lysozyme
MARNRKSSWKLRLLGVVVLIGVACGTYAWWDMIHWRPDRATYPVQGVEIGAGDGIVDWKALRAIGADFAYIDASASAFARDPAFVKNFEDARAAGMQIGAVHQYDPCQPAERQAANFVTVVPRDASLLPPTVELDMLADSCPVKVTDAAVQSELMTFLNQIETHTGKATILKISAPFESRYHAGAQLDRKLWLVRNRFQPDYAGRPWTLWTANTALANAADAEPVRWVVVQP